MSNAATEKEEQPAKKRTQKKRKIKNEGQVERREEKADREMVATRDSAAIGATHP
jgi:hypothetical protein